SLDFPATGDDHLARIAQVLGRDFKENCVELDAERDGTGLTGFAGIPTFNRGNAAHLYAFVNGRPVQDKLLLSAIRGAYAETVPHGRYPVTVLWLALDPALVDVNVHPAKADVRFRDPGHIRGLIVGAIREALTRDGPRTSTAARDGMAQAFRPGFQAAAQRPWSAAQSPYRPFTSDPAYPSGFAEPAQAGFSSLVEPSARSTDRAEEPAEAGLHPLGAARAQVHENYIITQTSDGIIIVDQHAAHERLVFEAMRQAAAAGQVARQVLLIPDIVDLPEEDCDRLMQHAEKLGHYGLVFERFGSGAICVRETPSLLGEVDCRGLLHDLADEIAELDMATALEDRLEKLAATMACYGSVRSGRHLRPEEMNALLRQMENTPGSGQCNHGRPTYIELKLKDIERLFGRSTS
ncbi:MAG: mismatch repair protein mutL, partial [Pseudomonadota bacterium]